MNQKASLPSCGCRPGRSRAPASGRCRSRTWCGITGWLRATDGLTAAARTGPRGTEPYEHGAQVGYALDALLATGTDGALVVCLSKAANWPLRLAVEHPGRMIGARGRLSPGRPQQSEPATSGRLWSARARMAGKLQSGCSRPPSPTRDEVSNLRQGVWLMRPRVARAGKATIAVLTGVLLVIVATASAALDAGTGDGDAARRGHQDRFAAFGREDLEANSEKVSR
jgi:hypothetical protein